MNDATPGPGMYWRLDLGSPKPRFADEAMRRFATFNPSAREWAGRWHLYISAAKPGAVLRQLRLIAPEVVPRFDMIRRDEAGDEHMIQPGEVA